MEATITLEYQSKKIATAVASAVSPDNFRTPAELSVKTKFKGKAVLTKIKCEGTLATFTATIDDLLFSASVAEKTLHAVRKI